MIYESKVPASSVTNLEELFSGPAMISYAQNREDVMVYRALKALGKGTYIDVGAGDPVNDSVTKYFYDQGWSGINIEPHPVRFQALKEQRTRDINLQSVLSDCVKECEFYYFEHADFSTYNSGESIFELQKIYPRLASKYVLCRFDAKSVIARKNPEGVISTWRTICQEFPDYQLVIKAIDLEKNASQELLELIRNTPRVLLIDEAVTPQINDALTSNARCYISLHRAEGLGLNILEAIFADVPAVFTNYSGLADELVGIGFAVDYQLTKIGNDAGPYPSDGLWAEPDLEHASKQLRAALNQVESGAWLNNQGSRSKFVGDFLQVNSATAIALVAQMMESVSLIERKFPLQSHLQFKDSRNVFLLKVHAFFKPAWSLLPLNLRIRLNQHILKIATAFIKE